MKVNKEDYTWAWKHALIDIVSESGEVFDKPKVTKYINEGISFGSIKKSNKKIVREQKVTPNQVAQVMKDKIAVIDRSIFRGTEFLKRKDVSRSQKKWVKDQIEKHQQSKMRYQNTLGTLEKMVEYEKQIALRQGSVARLEKLLKDPKLSDDQRKNLVKALGKTKKESEGLYKELKYASVKGEFKPAMSGSTKAAIAVATIAAILAGAYYVYKRYLSQATKTCQGKSGQDRQRCVLMFKINGAKAAILKLRENLPKCEYKKNPDRCKFQIQKQISKWNFRLQSYTKKLAASG